MLVTKLTVVNACLASMGEEPINSLAEENAFVTSALFSLEQAVQNEQAIGWYFNKEQLQLQPDTDGQYNVPVDIIDLDTEQTPKWLVLRGRRLYSTADAKYLTGTKPVAANVIRFVPFDDLPFNAKRLDRKSVV